MIQLTQSPFARTSSPVKQHIYQLKPKLFYRAQGTITTVIPDESPYGLNATLNVNSKNNLNNMSSLFLERLTDSYLILPTDNVLSNIHSTGFTIMFWFNSKDISSRDNQYCLFSLSSAILSNYPQNTVDVIKDTSSNSIFCRLSNSVYGDVSVASINNLTDNTDYHLALTLNPVTNKFTVYLNGIVKVDNTIVSPITNTNRPHCYIGKSCDDSIKNSTSTFKDIVLFDFDIGSANVATTYLLSAHTEKIYGVAKDSTYPYFPASVVLIRELPDGKTYKVIPDSSAYWEFYGTKDKVYEIVAYGPEGSMYKPEVIGPIELN